MLSPLNYRSGKNVPSQNNCKTHRKCDLHKKRFNVVEPDNLEVYDMRFNGCKYGILIYNKKNENFYMNLEPSTPTAIRPSSIYGSVVVKETLKPQNYTPTSSEIYNWICERSIPFYRQNLGSILSENKMSNYDPWELLKKNNGKNISDAWEIHAVKRSDFLSPIKRIINNIVVSQTTKRVLQENL